MTAQTPIALYLHGGPGMNARIERNWFGDRLPMLWWDQPRIEPETANPFSVTIEAAANELRRLRQQTGRPPALVATSFGARIALELVREYPANVHSLSLLAPALELDTSFLRMANFLVAKGIGGEALQQALASLPARLDFQAFLSLVQALLAIPDLMAHYWAPHSTTSRDRYLIQAAKIEFLDFPTFLAVSHDALNHPFIPGNTGYPGPVRILFGRYDPLFDPETDEARWRALFPDARIELVETGHMMTFELPEAGWMPVA